MKGWRSGLQRHKRHHKRDTRRAVMDTTLVKDLSPRGFQWKTIVCVARIWEHRDQATWQNLFEVDFIVIDQEGNKMEGCIPANRIDQFRDKIKVKRESSNKDYAPPVDL
ncbi:uncharacterized protein [Lolium perenne]|uniref:uncharacterized protein n=1 Tax=Lolium perenne TaxID=4522 RepID=UPI0021F5B504|nr:uncharacterized protein LOC127333390 isoform X2 [Lolium perenne]